MSSHRTTVLATLAAAALAAGLLAWIPAASAQPSDGQIISNGTISLGVQEHGHLNVPGPLSAGTLTPLVGLRFAPTNFDGIAPGCLCEGWGVADAATGITGHVNGSFGVENAEVETATYTSQSALTATAIDDPGGDPFLRVTHDYHPSPDTPFLYEVAVTIENLSDDQVDPRYRRVMDWDVEPTAFRENVTVDGTEEASQVLFASDNGFAPSDPLGARGSILFTGDAVDSGPEDHGALFDFGFDPLDPGEAVTFFIYYGAAPSEDDADDAVAAAGIEVFSYGQTADEPDAGTPNTFVFGFKAVGGTVRVPGVRLSSETFTVAEDGGSVAVGVELNGPAADPVQVTLTTSDGSATSPDDFAATTVDVSFAPGQVSQTVQVPVVDDAVAETDEFFDVALVGPANAVVLDPAAATVTITDDDAQPPSEGECMGLAATISHSGGGLVLGTQGDDVIVVTDDADTTIRALNGNDVICDGDGSGRIFGDAGADTILAGGGDDVVYGQRGDDVVMAGDGDDFVSLGPGDDEVHGGDGAEEAYGGPGEDEMFGDEGDDFLDGTLDDDVLFGGPGNDVLAGGAGADALFGEAGGDVLKGGDGDDSLSGGEGSDLLVGGSGDDDMNGDAGTDIHWAGPGTDTCTLQVADADTATAACENVVLA